MSMSNQQDMDLLADYLRTTKRKRVLVVEDDYMQALMIKGMLLEINGNLEVDIIEDAAASMTKIMEDKSVDPFDLVICDVNLGPTPAGNLVAYHCNFIYPSPKTILISASPETVDSKRKFDRFLAKPIEATELKRAVDSLLA